MHAGHVSAIHLMDSEAATNIVSSVSQGFRRVPVASRVRCAGESSGSEPQRDSFFKSSHVLKENTAVGNRAP